MTNISNQSARSHSLSLYWFSTRGLSRGHAQIPPQRTHPDPFAADTPRSLRRGHAQIGSAATSVGSSGGRKREAPPPSGRGAELLLTAPRVHHAAGDPGPYCRARWREGRPRGTGTRTARRRLSRGCCGEIQSFLRGGSGTLNTTTSVHRGRQNQHFKCNFW